MDEREFEALLDCHGPTLEKWPNHVVAEATALLSKSPQVKQAYDQAMKLEQLLSSLMLVPETRDLKPEILDVVAQDVQPVPWIEWLTGGLWKPAMAATVPLLLGFAVGFATTSSDMKTSEDEIVFFSSAEIDEMYEFAYATKN